MAQYPQGIFQSLQWLLKKVKILALQKQPTYTDISTYDIEYTLPGKGIYHFINANQPGNQFPIYFPNALFCNGETINIINLAPNNQIINGELPVDMLDNTIDTLNSQSYYSFVSINGVWRVIPLVVTT